MNIFDKMHCMKKFYAYTTKNLLRTTNPENVSLIGQILLKISFFKGQITRFEKTSLVLTVRETLRNSQNKTSIKIPLKTKLRIFFYRILGLVPP